jgi:hypothetical protein
MIRKVYYIMDIIFLHHYSNHTDLKIIWHCTSPNYSELNMNVLLAPILHLMQQAIFFCSHSGQSFKLAAVSSCLP